MFILSLETSTKKGSLCFAKVSPADLSGTATHKVLHQCSWEFPTQHSEEAHVALDNLFQKSTDYKKHLALITFGQGPGSFTGLRVATNIARSFGYALNIPIVPIPTPEILAWEALKIQPQSLITVLQNAYKNSLFISTYVLEKNSHRIKNLSPITLIPAEWSAINAHLPPQKTIVFIGDGLPFIPIHNCRKNIQLLSSIQAPKSSELLDLCLKSEGLKRAQPWNLVKPLYIKSSDAEDKLKQGKLKPMIKRRI